MGTLNFLNLDLLSVGVTVAATGILGFVIYFNNKKSVTNVSFLLFSLVTVFWGAVNYLNYQPFEPTIAFSLLKLTIALGVWQSFTFFQLSFVFPQEKIQFPRWHTMFLVPAVAVVSLLSFFTPLIFSHIEEISSAGRITKIANGPMIPLFGILVLGLVAGGIGMLAQKTIRARGIERRQFRAVLAGMVTTFALLMAFNFILPAFFENPKYIPLGALFILPFVLGTFYAIAKHKLLHAKVIATEILTFVLAIVTFIEVVLSKDPFTIVFRAGVLLLVLSFGVLLIRSVRKEIEQREELERLTKQLQDANLKLQELSSFKTQLLSIASHQIKSPLASIKGFVTLILEGSYGATTDQTNETLHKVTKSADELIGLVNTLLDLRKVEEGKMDYRFAPTDVVKMVQGVVEGLQPLAAAKHLALELSVPPGAISVSADEEKLKQVVQNLVDNAIKYTPSGFVKVTLEDAGGEAALSVADSGLGISPVLLPHLFEEFTRDERVKKEIKGTGLGLYIAKKIVEAHGGQMWAESPGDGKGSTFYVRLKKANLA